MTTSKNEARTIWVYRIPVNVLSASFTSVHHIPQGARLLHTASQAKGPGLGDIAMWYEIPDPETPKIEHAFQVFGTGTGPIRDGLTYVGTTLHHGGALVLHIYQVTDR